MTDTYVVPLTNREARRISDAKDHRRVSTWRDANSFHCTRWHTTHGVVTGIFGWKFYRGECSECGELVTARKRYPKKQDWHTGRWPAMHPECAARKRERHNDSARKRMARLRAQRKVASAGAYRYAGYEPPRQGVAPKDILPPQKTAGTWQSILHKAQPLVCARCHQPTSIKALRRRV